MTIDHVRRRLARLVERSLYLTEVAGDRLAAWLDPDDLQVGVPHPSPDTPAARAAAAALHVPGRYDPRPIDEQLFEPFEPPAALHDAVLAAFPDPTITNLPPGWRAHIGRRGLAELAGRRLEGCDGWPVVADVDPPRGEFELAREWVVDGERRQVRRPGVSLFERYPS